MANDYYNHGSVPANNSAGASAEMRAEFDAVQSGFAKLPTMTGNGGNVVKVNAGGTALETQAADALVSATINAATSKATPVDADELGIVDSAASNGLKKLTFANLGTWVWSKLGALIAGGTSKATPIDADTLPISDSAAANATKNLTWANLKATFFSALGALTAAGTDKATPADADVLAIGDSTASNATKKLTWANLKATFFSALGALTAAGTDKATPADADVIAIGDSAASNATKKLTIANLRSFFGSTFAALAGSASQDFATAILTATSVASTRGSTSAAHNTFTTLFTATRGTYLVSMRTTDAGTNYLAWALISFDTAVGLVLHTDAQVSAALQISGMNVQGKQLSGGTANIAWAALKIA